MDLTTYTVVLSDGKNALTTRIRSETVPTELSVLFSVPANEIRQAFPTESGYWCVFIAHDLTCHVCYQDISTISHDLTGRAYYHSISALVTKKYARVVDLTTPRPKTRETTDYCINPSGGC